MREHRYDVADINVHPRFGRVAQFDFDYALIRLARPIDFISHGNIRPVCLPAYDSYSDLVGRLAEVSGWGVINPANPNVQARKLQQVSVKVMSRKSCKEKYPVNPITDSMMCAAAPNRDACFGDSGGPMTMRDGSGPAVLEGVISWGKNCAKSQWPGVYARVGYVLNWIKDNTRDANFCSKRNTTKRKLDVPFDEDRVVFQQ